MALGFVDGLLVQMIENVHLSCNDPFVLCTATRVPEEKRNLAQGLILTWQKAH